jgi:outer membrane receptor protein involved in Fe transport
MGFLGGVLTYKIKTEYLNKAAYAQGTYNIFDAFSVTLGLRYTKDTTKGYGIKYLYKYLLAVQQAPTVTVQTPHIESSAPTGMLEFNYHPFDGFMTYAKYTRGYRQGSVNMLTDPGLDKWNPEHVNTYEIGAKTTFDGFVPGYINFAVFKNDLTDMQLQSGYISTTSGPTTAIFNAGKASSKGIEIESYFQPFDSLSVSLSYSHLNTKLVKSADFCANIQTAAGFISGLTCTPIALVGDELPFAPSNSYVANLNWTLPVSEDFGQILLGTTYAYTGNQRAAASNSSPYSVLPGFGVLNLNLSWTEIFGKPYDFNVYATNVLDTEYVTYLSGSYKLLGIDSRGAGTPRMIGARLKYNF